MNIILLEPHECINARCTLADARADHLRTFLHAAPGQTFQLGIVNGKLGIGTVEEVTSEQVTFTIEETCEALAPWYDLILAVPRPRSLKRILFQSAAMGVRRIYLVGAAKVEKSYFNMHLLRQEAYRPVLIDGLMQGKTTALPQVILVPKFRDLWAQLPSDSGLRLIANPAPTRTPLPRVDGLPLIAIGPDGGWTDAENQAFAERGFLPITLGARPLRTDTAAIALPAVIQDRLALN